MKRSVELMPFSREHHVVLERALQLRRATPGNVMEAVTAYGLFLDDVGRRHFDEEERMLIPLLRAEHAEAGARMVAEHDRIRLLSARLARDPGTAAAEELGTLLTDHVRFEERELFPLIERTAISPGLTIELSTAGGRARYAGGEGISPGSVRDG